ncbi:TrmO family methyltransferase [Micromonospora sp. M12]
MVEDTYLLHPVGRVASSLHDAASAPRQGDEGAPAAWLVFEPQVERALREVRVGAELLVLTWLDRARRDVLAVHPRRDETGRRPGVQHRSPHRPNPIGLHRVRVLAVDGLRVEVADMEALNGTPILDVKPVLGAVDER